MAILKRTFVNYLNPFGNNDRRQVFRMVKSFCLYFQNFVSIAFIGYNRVKPSLTGKTSFIETNNIQMSLFH